MIQNIHSSSMNAGGELVQFELLNNIQGGITIMNTSFFDTLTLTGGSIYRWKFNNTPTNLLLFSNLFYDTSFLYSPSPPYAGNVHFINIL